MIDRITARQLELRLTLEGTKLTTEATTDDRPCWTAVDRTLLEQVLGGWSAESALRPISCRRGSRRRC